MAPNLVSYTEPASQLPGSAAVSTEYSCHPGAMGMSQGSALTDSGPCMLKQGRRMLWENLLDRKNSTHTLRDVAGVAYTALQPPSLTSLTACM